MSVSQLDDQSVRDAVGITGYPPYTRFQDVALPTVTLTAGADTIGIDFTPSFFAYNKHYQVTWTTNFSAAAGTTGSIKWGISQNATPFAMPLLSQETCGVVDLSTILTAANAGQVIVSTTAVYLTETGGGFPPNITLFYQGTATSADVAVTVNEVSIIKLD